MSWARAGIFLIEAGRERKRLHSVAESLELPVLSSDSLQALRALKPHATTAFILGTGASAADLSSQKLEYIQNQFSIGVNQWALHSMVPDVYAYEVDHDVRLLQALDRPGVREKVPHLLFLKPSRPEDIPNASYLPEFMRERSFLYSRVNTWTKKQSNIGIDFKLITDSISRRRNPDILLDNGASVARMVALCVVLRFQEIVLVGVDLNNVEYFWHRSPTLLVDQTLRDFKTAQVGLKHETLSDDKRPFPVDIYIEMVGSALDLKVESPGSLLADYLPLWELSGDEGNLR